MIKKCSFPFLSQAPAEGFYFPMVTGSPLLFPRKQEFSHELGAIGISIAVYRSSCSQLASAYAAYTVGERSGNALLQYEPKLEQHL